RSLRRSPEVRERLVPGARAPGPRPDADPGRAQEVQGPLRGRRAAFSRASVARAKLALGHVESHRPRSPVNVYFGDVPGPTMTSPVAAVLSDPGYRRLFVSGLFVNVARWVDLVTLGWLALQLTGSPFFVGLAAFARTAPLMVVGLFTGIVADRVSRARLLVVAPGVAAGTALLP